MIGKSRQRLHQGKLMDVGALLVWGDEPSMGLEKCGESGCLETISEARRHRRCELQQC